MLLTPQHRRSERRNRKAPSKFNVSDFIKSNKIESRPGKLYHKSIENPEEDVEEENIYDECPTASFYYDKDMYLANDNYATLVDNAIKKVNQIYKK
jgi:hypothetical protein